MGPQHQSWPWVNASRCFGRMSRGPRRKARSDLLRTVAQRSSRGLGEHAPQTLCHAQPACLPVRGETFHSLSQQKRSGHSCVPAARLCTRAWHAKLGMVPAFAGLMACLWGGEEWQKKESPGDFLGSSVVKTPCFQYRVMGSIPGRDPPG